MSFSECPRNFYLLKLSALLLLRCPLFWVLTNLKNKNTYKYYLSLKKVRGLVMWTSAKQWHWICWFCRSFILLPRGRWDLKTKTRNSSLLTRLWVNLVVRTSSNILLSAVFLQMGHKHANMSWKWLFPNWLNGWLIDLPESYRSRQFHNLSPNYVSLSVVFPTMFDYHIYYFYRYIDL